MNLPFSPSFFKKLELYQELSEFEKEKKSVWNAEKVVLMELAKMDRIMTGQPISIFQLNDILSNALKKGVNKKHSAIETNISSHSWYTRDPQELINSLAVRGLAEIIGGEVEINGEIYPLRSIRINSKGYMAARVLSETKGLKKTGKYKLSIYFWYLFIGLTFLLVSLQIASLVKDLTTNKDEEKQTSINLIIPTPSE